MWSSAAVVLLIHAVAGSAFSPDPEVRAAVAASLIVVAVSQPLSGWVFVLDGVLIGAGDGVYLAGAGVITLVAYLPAAAAVAIVRAGRRRRPGLAVGGVHRRLHGCPRRHPGRAVPRRPLAGHRRRTLTRTPACTARAADARLTP